MFKKERDTINGFILLFIVLILLVSLLSGCSKRTACVPVIVHDTIEANSIITEYVYCHDTLYRDSIHVEYIDTMGVKVVENRVVVYRSVDRESENNDSATYIHTTTPAEEIAEQTAVAVESQIAEPTFWQKLRAAVIPFVIGLAVGICLMSLITNE